MNGSARRQALVVVAVLVALAGAWDQVLRPMAEARTSLREEVARAQALARFVESSLPAIRDAPRAVAPASPGLAAEQVERSVRRFGLAAAASRIEPRDTVVEVRLEAASFGTVVNWIAYCQDDLGLEVANVELSLAGSPGVVSGRVDFGAARL